MLEFPDCASQNFTNPAQDRIDGPIDEMLEISSPTRGFGTVPYWNRQFKPRSWAQEVKSFCQLFQVTKAFVERKEERGLSEKESGARTYQEYLLSAKRHSLRIELMPEIHFVSS